MRYILFSFLLLLYYSTRSQVVDSLKNDTLFLNNGVTITKGQKIKLGIGSRSDKGFAYLFTEPKKTIVPVKLDAAWTGYSLTVKGFKENNLRDVGKKIYLILSSGTRVNFWCDPDAAIQSKEIIIDGIK